MERIHKVVDRSVDYVKGQHETLKSIAEHSVPVVKGAALSVFYWPMWSASAALQGIVGEIVQDESVNQVRNLALIFMALNLLINMAAEKKALEKREFSVGFYGSAVNEITNRKHLTFSAFIGSLVRTVETASLAAGFELFIKGDKEAMAGVVATELAFLSTSLVNWLIYAGKANQLIECGLTVKGKLDRFKAEISQIMTEEISEVPFCPRLPSEWESLRRIDKVL